MFANFKKYIPRNNIPILAIAEVRKATLNPDETQKRKSYTEWMNPKIPKTLNEFYIQVLCHRFYLKKKTY